MCEMRLYGLLKQDALYRQDQATRRKSFNVVTLNICCFHTFEIFVKAREEPWAEATFTSTAGGGHRDSLCQLNRQTAALRRVIEMNDGASLRSKLRPPTT